MCLSASHLRFLQFPDICLPKTQPAVRRPLSEVFYVTSRFHRALAALASDVALSPQVGCGGFCEKLPRHLFQKTRLGNNNIVHGVDSYLWQCQPLRCVSTENEPPKSILEGRAGGAFTCCKQRHAIVWLGMSLCSCTMLVRFHSSTLFVLDTGLRKGGAALATVKQLQSFLLVLPCHA